MTREFAVAFLSGLSLGMALTNVLYVLVLLWRSKIIMPHCTRPPRGWTCSREAGHDGPCAASPTTGIGVVIAIGVVLCVIRVVIGFTCEPAPMTMVDVFKDMAHVFMGALGVLAWTRSPLKPLFWFMAALEVVVATLQRVL